MTSLREAIERRQQMAIEQGQSDMTAFRDTLALLLTPDGLADLCPTYAWCEELPLVTLHFDHLEMEVRPATSKRDIPNGPLKITKWLCTTRFDGETDTDRIDRTALRLYVISVFALGLARDHEAEVLAALNDSPISARN